MAVRLGTTREGLALSYDTRRYEFALDDRPAGLEELRALDADGLIDWLASEQRDWFRRVEPAALSACQARALAEAADGELSPEERVRADAARDDGILAGKIVDADPALVQAVADALTRGGFSAELANPLAQLELPKGMEALSQFERAEGSRRKMTPDEERLMRKILKNDDRQKGRREQEAGRSGGRTAAGAADHAGGAVPDGAPDADAPSVPGAESEQESPEERALEEMRERNRTEAAQLALEHAYATRHGPFGRRRRADGAPDRPEPSARTLGTAPAPGNDASESGNESRG